MESERLHINGHYLYTERYGTSAGPIVVLLHHGLGAIPAWRAQIMFLAEAGFTVLAYDRWGYGRSEARTNFSMPAFEDDLVDLGLILKHYGYDRVNLVGHSDGGTIALYYAAANPGQVERLVTVAAHVYVEPKMRASIEAVRLDFEQNERFRTGLSRLHGTKVDQVLYGWFDGWHRPASLQWDMRPVLARVKCPVLVVQGEDDEHALPQHARDLAAALPEAELWLEPGVGHMLPQECPEVFNQRLLAFLKNDGNGGMEWR